MGKGYTTDFNPKYDNSSYVLPHLSIEEMMIIANKTGTPTDEVDGKNFGNPILTTNSENFPYLIKYDTDEYVYYFVYANLFNVVENNFYQINYEMLMGDTIFSKGFKYFEQQNPMVHFKRKFMDRFLINLVGKYYISMIKQGGFNKQLPFNFPLIKNEILPIPITEFRNYKQNATPKNGIFASDHIISNETIFTNGYMKFYYGWKSPFVVIHTTIDYKIDGKYNIGYDDNSSLIFIDTTNFTNSFSSSQTAYVAGHNDVYLSKTPINQYKVLSKIDERIFDFNDDGTPKGDFYIDKTKFHGVEAYKPPDGPSGQTYMTIPAHGQQNDDYFFNLEIVENGTLKKSNKCQIQYIFHPIMPEEPEMKDKGLIQYGEVDMSMMSYYLVVLNEEATEGDVNNRGQKINYQITSYENNFLPIFIKESLKPKFSIKRDFFDNAKFNNKMRYLICTDGCLNRSMFSTEEIALENEITLGSSFVIIPMMNDFEYDTITSTTTTTTKVVKEDYYYEIFKFFDNPQQNDPNQLILTKDNIVNSIETIFPADILYKGEKIAFYQAKTGQLTANYPIFCFCFPQTDGDNFSDKITLYDKELDFDFDFTKGDATNEPTFGNQQFLSWEFNFSNQSSYKVPLQFINFMEDTKNIQLNFHMTIDSNFNLVQDIDVNFDDNLPHNIQQDNFILTLNQPWTFQTSAYNNGVVNNMTTEKTARANYADDVKSMENTGGQNVLNTGLSTIESGFNVLDPSYSSKNVYNKKGDLITPRGFSFFGGSNGGRGISNLGGSAAANILGFGLNTITAFKGLNVERQNMNIKIQNGYRSLDSEYTNIRMSPNMLNMSNFVSTNINASPYYYINETSIFDEQKQTVMDYLYRFGYMTDATFDFNAYKNRKFYNVIQLDTSYNTEKLREYLYNSPINKIFKNNGYIDGFLAFLSQPHGIVMDEGLNDPKNNLSYKVNNSANIERDFCGVEGKEINNNPGYLCENVMNTGKIQIYFYGNNTDGTRGIPEIEFNFANTMPELIGEQHTYENYIELTLHIENYDPSFNYIITRILAYVKNHPMEGRYEELDYDLKILGGIDELVFACEDIDENYYLVANGIINGDGTDENSQQFYATQ